MSANPYASRLAEYTQVSAHAGVAAADRHKLILMLMDGALERLAAARGCIVRQDAMQKAHLVHRAVAILGELRASLDFKQGGSVAANLGELYDYMIRRVLLGSLQNKAEYLEEVSKLLGQVREAWVALPAKAAAQLR
jgi:flagellar protein FliS